jgi:FtsP/CotA-like multicopper oxidase with cupredoxin domain
MMTQKWLRLASALALLAAHPASATQPRVPALACPSRPTAGSAVSDPESLHSANGVLNVELSYRASVDSAGQTHYCYVYKDGLEAPTLRLQPGELLILRLKNEVKLPPDPTVQPHSHGMAAGCAGRAMTSSSTNMHFHGLSVPPKCHQDDVLHTLIDPGDRAFEYQFRIPPDQTPGLYWYHPHVHGLTKTQVLGGASGALIVEGIERANPLLAGLAERVLVIRDQELVNPNAEPIQTDSMPAPLVLRDAEGDILNTGTGGGKPAKDLSINFVPVPYPAYSPAVMRIRPGERQLWRVLNASAITYLDLQLLIDNKPQPLGVVALDGAPLGTAGPKANQTIWQSHILLPPAGRAEFIVKGPPESTKASLVTRTIDTGPAGENDPTRPLATVISAPEVPEPETRTAVSPSPLPPATSPWLGDVAPVRTRRLYFSEQAHDPQNPNSPTDFYLTVGDNKPKLFDPESKVPDIIAHQGDVEDWIIENRTRELHTFHIHQTRFVLLEWNGVPLQEPFLRDTVNVAYWDGTSSSYPSVKVRVDFRSPSTVGTFVYHCHLLEHEDGGMMGLIRVDPAQARSDP